MANINPVSFLMPGYAESIVGLAAIERQRKLADLLRQQSLEPLQTQTVGGWAVPASPLAPFAKMAQGYAATRAQEAADARQMALIKGLTGAYSGMFGTQPSEPTSSTAVQSALSGPATTTDELGDVRSNLGPTNANAAALAAQLRTDPTSGITKRGPLQFGNQTPAEAQLRFSLDPSKYMEALFKDLTPTETTKRLRELGISEQSAQGRAILQQALQKDVHIPPVNLRSGGVALDPMTNQPILSNPVPPPGTMNQWQPGSPYPTNQLVPGAQENAARGEGLMTTARKEAEAPYSMQQIDVPVYLPGGDQINVKMNATQAHQYQITGRLPPEIAASIPGYQQPGPMPAPTPSPTPAPSVIPSPAPTRAPLPVSSDRQRIWQEELTSERQRLTEAQARGDQQGIQIASQNIADLERMMRPRPVVGRGQTQAERITQERQAAGGKATDETFAKEYVAFTQGGIQDATKQLSQLDEVITALSTEKPNLTGPYLGITPDVALNFINPKAVAMHQRVTDVVQRSLRAILGSQFTENEGTRIISVAYNPSQPEAENKVRLERLRTQLGQALEAKISAIQHFEQNGTLQGWQGKLPNIRDFDPSAGRKASGSIGGMPQPAMPQRRSTDRPMAGKTLRFDTQGNQLP